MNVFELAPFGAGCGCLHPQSPGLYLRWRACGGQGGARTCVGRSERANGAASIARVDRTRATFQQTKQNKTKQNKTKQTARDVRLLYAQSDRGCGGSAAAESVGSLFATRA